MVGTVLLTLPTKSQRRAGAGTPQRWMRPFDDWQVTQLSKSPNLTSVLLIVWVLMAKTILRRCKRTLCECTGTRIYWASLRDVALCLFLLFFSPLSAKCYSASKQHNCDNSAEVRSGEKQHSGQPLHSCSSWCQAIWTRRYRTLAARKRRRQRRGGSCKTEQRCVPQIHPESAAAVVQSAADAKKRSDRK